MGKEINELPIALAINRGSSSIRFSVFGVSDYGVLMSDIADGINSENVLLSVNGGEPASLAYHSYEGVLKVITFELEKRNLDDNVASISHRTTHGGSIFVESAIITDKVIDSIRRVSPLAPLHNYANLSGIESAQQLFLGITRVTVSDTSFRQTMAPKAYLYGLPWKYCKELDVRRYGFHGTSHRYVSQRTHPPLNLAEDNSGLAMTHLGNDTSIYTVRNGQSVDISVGTTPLEDLMMDTRSSDVDFGAVSWAASQTSQGLGDLKHVVNEESGLLSIPGLSSDLCVLEKAWHEGHERTQLAIKTFVHRAARHTAGHAALLRRLDGIIFTGGIGEDPSLIRCLVMEYLAVLGVMIDAEVNNRSNSFGRRIVSSESARAICAVIPTNEEKMIVLDVIHLGRVNASAEFA